MHYKAHWKLLQSRSKKKSICERKQSRKKKNSWTLRKRKKQFWKHRKSFWIPWHSETFACTILQPVNGNGKATHRTFKMQKKNLKTHKKNMMMPFMMNKQIYCKNKLIGQKRFMRKYKMGMPQMKKSLN